MLHHIQRSILDKLASKESARYSEINAGRIDGNTFTYHLRQLITARYIIRNDEGLYKLTQKGVAYIVRRYEDPQKETHSVFLIVIKDTSGKYLLRRRLVQPHLNFSGFVHGEPKDHEPLLETAKTRLLSKTGLRAELEVHSSGLVRFYDARQLQSFSHCIIIVANSPEGDLVKNDEAGENFWLSLAEIKAEKTLPSTSYILNMLENNDTSFFDISYDLTK